MVDLVALPELKIRLGFDFDHDDATLTLILGEAQDHVLKYVAAVDDAWTAQTVPARIKSAIILVSARLYANRDDDGEILTPAVKSLLRRDRKPVVA